MEINHTMSISMTLTDFCSIRQTVKLKNAFANIVYSVLVVKRVSWNIERYV